MQGKQDILFVGGLNSDDSLEMLPKGDYLDLENARNFDGNSDNKLGKITKVKGTTKITNNDRLSFVTTFDVDDNDIHTAILSYSQTVGTVKDSPNNKLYYFVYEIYSFDLIADRYYYVIYEYDNLLKKISNLVVRTTLEIFDKDLKVKWGNVISGKLTWCQKTIEPKMIEIERAINFTKNYYDNTELTPAYTVMTMQEFDVIRRPPVDIIKAEYKEDADYILNNLKGRLFQFRAKYVYIDNSESVWGMISTVALPYGEYDANGDYSNDHNFNYLELNYVKPSYDIKEIWLASRYIDRDGILRDFVVFEKQDVSDYAANDSVSYDFYNDISGKPLSDNEDTKLVDLVPLAAGTQEVISNPDRLAYGNITDPVFDNIDTDVTITVVATNITEAAQDIGSNTNSNVVFTSKNSLAAYRIDGRKLYLNGKGIVTMIQFDNTWIAAGANYITVKLTVKVSGVAYTYTTSQIIIEGLADEEITDKIIDRINTDYQEVGTATVAYRTRQSTAAADYQDFVDDMKGGSSNTYTHKWTGVESYQLYGATPTGHCIIIRAGLFFSNIPSLEEVVDFPTLSCKVRTLITSLSTKRYLSTKIGDLYMSANIVNGGDDLHYVYTPDGSNYPSVFKVKDFDGYLSVTYNSVPILLSAVSVAALQEDGLGRYLRPTLPPFGKYGVGLAYYDNNLRPMFVQELEDVFIERADEDYQKAIIYNLRLSINHVVPSRFKYWSVVLTKNLNQETLTEVDLSIDTTPITDDADYIYIDVNTSIDLWNTTYNNTTDVYQPYGFTRGDRVLLYNVTTSKYIDKEIIAVNDDGNIMIQLESLAAADIGDIVRFYTPQVRYVDPLYFEVGKIYPTAGIKTVLVDGEEYIYHETNTDIQNSTTPLVLDLPFGDIYLNAINMYALKTLIGTTTNPTYNEFFMPFYHSNLNSFGRTLYANDKLNLGFYGSRIRMSNALIQDSFTMGLNSFDSTDLLDIPEKHGTIQGLAELGYTLKVVTETKTMSIYINRTVTVDPNGVEGVLLIHKTLGTLAIPRESHGTIYPNSIEKTDKNLYLLDTLNGCSVRDSANGQFKISDYKYASFIKRLCKNIEASTSSVEVFSTFNINEYYIILDVKSSKFLGVPDDKGNAIVFNEDSSRWTHHLRLIDSRDNYPEWSDNIGNSLITFISGELFVNDDSDSYCEFYSKFQEPEIEFVFNENPKDVKLAVAMSIHANSLWQPNQDGDITIPPNITYANGMSSRLKPAKFRKKEGLFYSEFLHNGLTPNMTYDEGVRHGQKLRGNLMRIRLRNADKLPSDLFSVSIKYTSSELSY